MVRSTRSSSGSIDLVTPVNRIAVALPSDGDVLELEPFRIHLGLADGTADATIVEAPPGILFTVTLPSDAGRQTFHMIVVPPGMRLDLRPHGLGRFALGWEPTTVVEDAHPLFVLALLLPMAEQVDLTADGFARFMAMLYAARAQGLTLTRAMAHALGGGLTGAGGGRAG